MIRLLAGITAIFFRASLGTQLKQAREAGWFDV
jgi:hypothetical protein